MEAVLPQDVGTEPARLAVWVDQFPQSLSASLGKIPPVNVIHEVRGVTGTIAELSRHFQIPAQVVYVRKHNGMSLEDALTKPYNPVGKQKFLRPPGPAPNGKPLTAVEKLPPDPPAPQLVPDPDPHEPVPSPLAARLIRGYQLPPNITDGHVQLWEELASVDMRLSGLTAERARILDELRKLGPVE